MHKFLIKSTFCLIFVYLFLVIKKLKVLIKPILKNLYSLAAGAAIDRFPEKTLQLYKISCFVKIYLWSYIEMLMFYISFFKKQKSPFNCGFSEYRKFVLPEILFIKVLRKVRLQRTKKILKLKK